MGVVQACHPHFILTMKARNEENLEEVEDEEPMLVADPGLRLDTVDLGEESPDIFFKYTFNINFSVTISLLL